jgi:hypothetical protein
MSGSSKDIFKGSLGLDSEGQPPIQTYESIKAEMKAAAVKLHTQPDRPTEDEYREYFAIARKLPAPNFAASSSLAWEKERNTPTYRSLREEARIRIRDARVRRLMAQEGY